MKSLWTITTGMAACITLLLNGCAHVGQGTGWRGNGTGIYAEADPPIVWSSETNVTWKSKMPDWSNASPVLVADSVFVCAEPDEIICINKADGTFRWRRNVKLSDTWSEEDRTLAAAKERETQALKKEYDDLDNRINDAWAARKKDPKNPELRKKYKDLQNRQKDVRKKISENSRWAPAQTEPTNGYTSATPVSDGKHVWVVMGSGVVACFDLQGNRKWIVFVDRPTDQFGTSASPVLADGKLLVHLKNLKALDPMSGKTLWEAKEAFRKWGTPFVSTLHGTTVALTARGEVVRVKDGKLLAKGGGHLEFASPILINGKACFIQGDGQLTKLFPGKDGALRVEKAWSCTLKRNRYYASVAAYGGLIYVIAQDNVLSVIDESTGRVLETVSLPLGKGDAYASVTLAGRYLFVGNENGKSAVLRPGIPPQVVSVNALDPGRATPTFEGKRMYIRTRQWLYCLGE